MNSRSILIQTLSFTIAFFIGIAAQAQNKFTVRGQLGKNIQGRIIYRYNKDYDTSIKDSVMVTNGAFHFTGNISDPVTLSMVFLGVNQVENTMAYKKYKVIMVDPGVVTITGLDSLEKANIKAGKTEADNQEYSRLIDVVNQPYMALAEKQDKFRKNGKTDSVAAVKKEMTELMVKGGNIDSVFIKKHPGSFAAFFFWSAKLKKQLTEQQIVQFNNFSKSIRNSVWGKFWDDKIKLQQKLAPGQVAPEVSVEDTIGKKVTLSSLKGKYVLLLFYKKSNMADQIFEEFAYNLRRVSKRLKDKNFVILGVNYDTDKQWRKVREQTTYNWVHGTDAGGINGTGAVSETAKVYGLTMTDLTRAYLIGPDGRIMMSRPILRDNELSLKIDKMIN